MSRMKHVDALAMATLLKNEYEGADHYLSRQLAEECCEYAQMVFKSLRSDAHETPVPEEKIVEDLHEELADVILCADIIYAWYAQNIPEVREKLDHIMEQKRLRAIQRIEDRKKEVFGF